MTSLSPPTAEALLESTSTRQPCASAYRLYILKTSCAKSVASSPPVPARISSTTFFSSFGSLGTRDRKSTRLNSSHLVISYAVFCLKKKKKNNRIYVAEISPNVNTREHEQKSNHDAYSLSMMTVVVIDVVSERNELVYMRTTYVQTR